MLFVSVWIAMAVAAAVVASAKGRSAVAWFGLGLVGGIFAVLYVSFAPRWTPSPEAQGSSAAEREIEAVRRANRMANVEPFRVSDEP